MRNLVLTFLGLAFVVSTSANTVPFASRLFYEIAHDKANENVIFSPSSIKSCLGLAYMGAEGETATEIYDALQLEGSSKDEVGAHFQKYFEKLKNSGVDLKTANRIYLANRYTIAPKYEELLSKYFDSTSVKLDFADTVAAAGAINTWVEEQTNHKIHDIVSPDAIDAGTSAVLVNAIYFKASWRYRFNENRTTDVAFYQTKDNSSPVKMMHESMKIAYTDLPELKSKAILLPYSKTNIQMLVILPDEVDGLTALEEKLKNEDVTKFAFDEAKVNLKFPKFKIEFDISLSEKLQNLGIKHMFDSNSDFSGITVTKDKVNVSNVQHKAFIEVDENGTEAAAATAAFLGRSLAAARELSVDFKVDHPFFYAIVDYNTVYFAGHVVSL